MLTIVANTENPKTIAIPPEEMEKLGVKSGDQVEVSKNEMGEIILRTKQSERTKKIIEATREIIQERKSALIELGKGHE